MDAGRGGIDRARPGLEAGQSVVPRALQHFAERAEGLAAGAVDTVAMLGPSFHQPGFEQGFEL